MKILITGAGGFIGSHLMQAFCDDGHEIDAIYRNTKPVLQQRANGVNLLKCDLSRPMEMKGDVDVIIHCAGLTSLAEEATARDFISSNVNGTINVSDYADAVNAKLIIYLSTISVYGIISTKTIDETTPIICPDMYGVSKYVAEQVLMETRNRYSTVCIRLPGVVGKGSFSTWLGSTLYKMLKNKPVTIYNPSAPFNNIVDLHELKRFISHIIESGFNGHQMINMAASKPISMMGLVDLLKTRSGSSSKINTLECDKQSFSISTDKVRINFGYLAGTTEHIVTRYVDENMNKNLK